MLQDFILEHREELIERARAKVALRLAPRVTDEELTNGIPLFLTQLEGILRQDPACGVAMQASAAHHGGELLNRGFSIAQVVHDYGDLCQAVTELALELRVSITTEGFHTLNRCLDDAIASAVTEYARQRDVDSSGAEVRRQAFLAHELRNHLHTAMLAFEVVKSGKVGVQGSTMEVLDRSLRGLRHLVDRSLTEVRLTAGIHHKERVCVAELLEELEIDGAVVAADHGLEFSVERVDSKVVVEVDRHLFTSAISNLLQNAFKFTRRPGHVRLRSRSTDSHVSIEIEDECGGLPPGVTETLFRPFEQRGVDRAGLGVGLTISRQAIEADGGKISLRGIPARGCVFTVEMPLAVHDSNAG